MTSTKRWFLGWLPRESLAAALTKAGHAAWEFAKTEVVPQITAIRIRHRLRQDEALLASKTLRLDGLELDETALQSALVVVEADYKNEEERRNKLTEKARAALLIIGVVVALVTSSPTFLSASGIHLHEVVILVCTVFMFVLSAVTLTLAVDVRAWHGRYLDEKITRCDDILRVNTTPPRDEIVDLYHACKLNQLILTDLANLVSASYLGIRNGILCLAFLFVMVVIRLAFAPVGPEASRNVIDVHEIKSLQDAISLLLNHHSDISRVTIPANRTSVLRGRDGRPILLKSIGMIVEFNDRQWYVIDNNVAESVLNDRSKPLDGITIRIE